MTAQNEQQHLWVTSEPLKNLTSVNNEGMAVGYPDLNQPFYIWNPFEDTYTLIGGMGPGDGVGGNPRFSDDGKLISGSMPCEAIPVKSGWEKSEFADFAGYKFHQIAYVSDYNIFAVGEAGNGKEGIILKTADNGISWKRADMMLRQREDGSWETIVPDSPLRAIGLVSSYVVLAGGDNGLLLTGSGNGSWQTLELVVDGTSTPAKTYYAIDFMTYTNQRGGISSTPAQYGCIGVEQEDGTYAVWYTEDSSDNFSVADGVAGKPVSIIHVGETFYMATENGHVQVSLDYGKTWDDLFTTKDNMPLHRIVFADENKGIALADNVVYITTDGGETWEQKTIFKGGIGIWSASYSTWNDATWVGDVITLVGTNGCIYRSTDNGESFSELKIGTSNYTELGAILYNNNNKVYNVLGNEGTFFRCAEIEAVNGYCGGIYNVETNEWTPLESSGYTKQGVASSPWNISGDGKNVVGICYDKNKLTNDITAYAAVWNTDKGLTVLENKFEKLGKACRANAVSYDGSVIVGWQDIFGPWYATVWRKNAQGSYDRTLMTIDPATKTEKDMDFSNVETNAGKQESYENLLGYCQSVSADGKYIGGRGGSGLDAVTGPWIWSEEDGYTTIIEDCDGTTSDIYADGSKACGWLGTGSSAWLWTKEDGVQYLQEYAENVLGEDMGDFYIISVYDMSANGRYVTGYGFLGGEPMGYVLDIMGNTTSIDNKSMAQVKAALYPNPVADELHVDLPFSAKELAGTTITMVNLQGAVVSRVNNATQSNVINVSNLTDGVYVLDVNAQGNHKSFKVIVRH